MKIAALIRNYYYLLVVQLLKLQSSHNSSHFIVVSGMQLENFLVLILQCYLGFCSYKAN